MKRISEFPKDILDKNGTPIREDDVIYDGNDLYRVYWDSQHYEIEAFSPTCGYLEDTSKENLSKFERIGTFEECKQSMIVD